MKRKWMIASCLCLPLLWGCPTKKIKAPQEIQASKVAINTQVNRFLKGFFKKQPGLVMSSTTFPFFFNNQVILSAAKDLEPILIQINKTSPATDYRVLHSQTITPSGMAAFNQVAWAKFLEYGYHEQVYTVMVLEIRGKKVFKEKIVLIQDPESNWKVSGFIR